VPPSQTTPPALRNVALVAHVDHGKTTLVDALLRATGVFGEHQQVVDRVMDSNDQERERGITILAKAAAVEWKGVRINLVDTPGHSDFGGEVERALTMVDGVVLLVDAAEGPLPQTRYVLSKALASGLPAVVVLNKVDRGDARPDEVLDEIYQLFLDLDADEESIEFPVISAIARDGKAVAGVGMPGDDDDLTPLFEAIVATVPAPEGDPGAPLQAIVTNLDASDYLGRLAIGRVVQGTLRRNEQIALCEEDEGQAPLKRKLSQLMCFSGIGRLEVDYVAAGDLFVVAGFPEVEIGDTLADPANPVALPRLTVDEPVLRMTFGVNTSPLAGKEGTYLTSRHLRDRLDREVLGNVSIKVDQTSSPDVIEVAGRGELQLAVLIETMRREGYELQVSRPEVIVARSTASVTSPSSARSSTSPTSTSVPSPRRSPPARARSPTSGPATPDARSSRSRRRRAGSSGSDRSCSPPQGAPRSCTSTTRVGSSGSAIYRRGRAAR
jgi:GTP-binding protein